MARKLPKNDDEWEGTPEDDFGAGKEEEEEELDDDEEYDGGPDLSEYDDDEVRRYQKEIRALEKEFEDGHIDEEEYEERRIEIEDHLSRHEWQKEVFGTDDEGEE